MSVNIHEVRSRKDLGRFIKFPFTLYKNNKYWIPPLLMDEWNTLDSRKNPAFKHCRVRFLLAEKDGRLVGRIAGIINQKYIEKWGHKHCRFGWFDFIDDNEVSRILLEAVEAWTRENGLTAVHGPLGFTDMDREGMLIEGFEELGTMATLYNHPYYPRHMETLGYGKDIDWVEFEVQIPKEIPERALRLQELVLKRSKLRIVETKKKHLRSYAKKMFDLINEAYADLYGYVTLTDEQIDVYIDQYFGFIHPDFVRFITDEEDNLIAFGIAMPSLSRALQRSKGRLFPFGFIPLLWALKYPKYIDLLLVAVRPDYQARGITAILMTEFTRNCMKNGIISAETNVELETNTQVQAIWKHYQVRQHKRRRCFIKNLS
ncbi:MAG: GCN5 family acetyltransferase [Spirochaetaceae bacterium]|nr:MAG: GCN5 family acetyltransferase [Spirochaetaceae bacterium]